MVDSGVFNSCGMTVVDSGFFNLCGLTVGF